MQQINTPKMNHWHQNSCYLPKTNRLLSCYWAVSGCSLQTQTQDVFFIFNVTACFPTSTESKHGCSQVPIKLFHVTTRNHQWTENKTLISCPNSIIHGFWAESEFVVKSHQQSDWISVQSVAVVESGCSLTKTFEQKEQLHSETECSFSDTRTC